MNPHIPRSAVHTWSEQIGEDLADHRVAVVRLLKDNRRLSRFVEENAASLEGAGGSVCQWLVGVVIRIFELSGGRMRAATWEQVRAASARVQGHVEGLLPFDSSFPDRARAVERRQAHILDEALYNLFERTPKEGEVALPPVEAAKVYLMMWVATEVLDENWAPPVGFAGEKAYEFSAV